jgi:flagellar motility protein MotE (MotC chaperone)
MDEDENKGVEETKSNKEQSVAEQGGVDLKLYLIGGGVALITMIIVGFILVFYVINQNVNNVAILNKERIEKIPILKSALPKSFDPDSPSNFSDRQLRRKYNEILNERNDFKNIQQDLEEKILNLEQELEEFKAMEDQKEDLALKEEKLKLDIEKLEEDILAFQKKIAQSDIAGFRGYYEGLDEEQARVVYQEVLEAQMVDDGIKELAKIYENMTSGVANEILQNMAKNEKDMVVSIIRQMKPDIAGRLLSSMDSQLAAEISSRLIKR